MLEIKQRSGEYYLCFFDLIVPEDHKVVFVNLMKEAYS